MRNHYSSSSDPGSAVQVILLFFYVKTMSKTLASAPRVLQPHHSSSTLTDMRAQTMVHPPELATCPRVENSGFLVQTLFLSPHTEKKNIY